MSTSTTAKADGLTMTRVADLSKLPPPRSPGAGKMTEMARTFLHLPPDSAIVVKSTNGVSLNRARGRVTSANRRRVAAGRPALETYTATTGELVVKVRPPAQAKGK